MEVALKTSRKSIGNKMAKEKDFAHEDCDVAGTDPEVDADRPRLFYCLAAALLQHTTSLPG